MKNALITNKLRFRGVSFIGATALVCAIALGMTPLASATPEIVLTDNDGIAGFELYGKGILWWLAPGTCPGQAANVRARITNPRTDPTTRIARDCAILGRPFANAVRDEDGNAYYFKDRRLRWKPISAGEAAADTLFPLPIALPILPANQPASFLEIGDGKLFWGSLNSGTGQLKIYFSTLDGSQAGLLTTISNAGAEVRKMRLYPLHTDAGDDMALGILLANGKMYDYRFGTDFVVFIGNDIADFAAHTRFVFLGSPINYVYIAASPPGPRVLCNSPAGRITRINMDTYQTTTVYTAPGNRQILGIAVDSPTSATLGAQRYLFISEASLLPGDAGFCRHGDPAILRGTLPTPSPTAAGWDTLCISGGGYDLSSDREFIYFRRDQQIRRIRKDAPPVIDLEAFGVEVVQAVQNWNHEVPILAQKSNTTVRGYARIATNGTTLDGFRPSARLEARVDGVALNGSPFSPTNSPSLPLSADLATVRGDETLSYQFRLPPLPTGELEVTFTVNPDQNPLESGPNGTSNNSVSRELDVLPSRKACLVMVPIPTGVGTFSTSDSTIPAILRRASSLLPVNSFDLRPWLSLTNGHAQDLSSSVFFATGGALPGGDEPALEAVECLRESSNRPGNCPVAVWVGMVHPDVNGFNGLGYRPGRSLICRMSDTTAYGDGPTVTNPWNDPRGGRTLAHEFGHNLGRKHIGCARANPPANQDGNYPFPDCQFGAGGATGHVGFDSISGRAFAADAPAGPASNDVTQLPNVVTVNTVGPLMSYASSRWVSPYTWGGIHAGLVVSPAADGGGAPDGEDSPVLFVNGKILEARGGAVFSSFFALPESSWPAENVAHAFEESATMKTDDQTFYLVQRDAFGGDLARTPLPVSELDEGDGSVSHFSHYVPFHPQARRVQLLRGQGALWAERLVSLSAPDISLDPIIVDEVTETLSLSWQAHDPDGDPLLFLVHYSPDDGESWFGYRINYPARELLLDTRFLAGSDRARIRVVATDGVRSTAAVSDPFRVPKHAPTAVIGGLKDNEAIPFGSRRQMTGVGIDPEDGSSGVSHSWSLTGPTLLESDSETLELVDLAPGDYTVRLQVRDRDGMASIAERDFEVLPMSLPESAKPPVVDGMCADSAYDAALFFRIPFGNGTVRVRMVHSGDSLYVSFADLPLPTLPTLNPRFIGLRVDVDGDGSASAGSEDRGFFVDEFGLFWHERGNASGTMQRLATPQSGFRAVVSRGGTSWCAEYCIDDSLLGGWMHAARFMFESSSSAWPEGADRNRPATWSRSILAANLPPQPNKPPVADAGERQVINVSGNQLVVLDGTASSDPDDDPLSYSWTQTAGTPVLLSDPNEAGPNFLASGIVSPSELQFELVVSDGQASSAPATVRVKLAPASVSGVAAVPQPLIRIEGGSLAARFTGFESGERVRIDVSEDLLKWEDYAWIIADFRGVLEFVDPEIEAAPRRFYRTVSDELPE